MHGDEGKESGSNTDYRSLPKRSLTAMYISSGIYSAVALAVLAVLIICREEIPSGLENLILSLFSVVVLATVAYCLVSPPIFYRHYRYSIDDDRLDVLSGVVFRTHVLVPVERIHQVLVTRGPIDRAFKLADVTVTTAGGTFTMKRLDDSEAEAIASKLNGLIVRLLKARDRCPKIIAIIRLSS